MNHDKLSTFYLLNRITKRREGGIVNTFLMLLMESVILQGLITASLVLTTCYLWATGRVVPTELWTADTIVLGFFFGAKTQQTVSAIKRFTGG